MIANRFKISLNSAKGKDTKTDKLIDFLLELDSMQPIIDFKEVKKLTNLAIKHQKEIIEKLAAKKLIVYEDVEGRSAYRIYIDADTEYAKADRVIRTIDGQEYLYKDKGKWLSNKVKYTPSEYNER